MPPPQADILPAPGRWIRVLSLKLFTMLGVHSLSLLLSRSLSLSLTLSFLYCMLLFCSLFLCLLFSLTLSVYGCISVQSFSLSAVFVYQLKERWVGLA